MKKFLGILVLGLLFCGNAYAGHGKKGELPKCNANVSSFETYDKYYGGGELIKISLKKIYYIDDRFHKRKIINNG